MSMGKDERKEKTDDKSTGKDDSANTVVKPS